MTLQDIVEALLLVSPEPLDERQLLSLLANEGVGRSDLEAALRRLQQACEDRPLELVKVAGGWRYQVRREFSPWVSRLFPEKVGRYSRALLETLAIIAYRQPITKPEIDHIRGVNSDYAIRRLQELELIEVKGRSDTIGRPLLYGTTPRFLEHFGLNSLDDLPELPELQQLLENPEVQREHLRLLYPLDPEQNEASE